MIGVALVACRRDADRITADPVVSVSAPPPIAPGPTFVTPVRRDAAERAIVALSPIWRGWQRTTTPSTARLEFIAAPPNGCPADDRPCAWTFETVEIVTGYETCEVNGRTGVVRCGDWSRGWTVVGNALDAGTDAPMSEH